MNDYRFDVRSEKQFKKDIKHSHKLEAEIAVRLCIAMHAKNKEWPKLIPTGVDNTGEFIENTSDITLMPDFQIGEFSVEIIRSDVVCNRIFHQKINKVKKALEQGYHTVFVNGYKQEKQPNFLWLDPDSLRNFTNKAIAKYGEVPHPGAGKVGFIGKKAYRYDIYWFKDLWRPLPVLIKKDLPKNYTEILKAIKV